MPNRFLSQKSFFILITTAMIAIAVFCFAAAASWVNKPFPGFLIYKSPYVGSMGSRTWTGYQAGIRYLDRIVSVDWQPVQVGKKVLSNARGKTPGTLVHYRYESKGATHELDLPVAVFNLGDFLLVFLAPFLGGLFLYGLGFTVYILKPAIKSSWLFLALCFFTGSYMITGFEIMSTQHLLRFHLIVTALFPATFLHLGLIFPEKRKFLDRWPFAEYAIYLPALLFVVLYQLNVSSVGSAWGARALSWVPSWKTLSTLVRYFTLFCATSLVLLQVFTTFKPRSSIARERARIILFGVTFAFMPIGIIMFIVLTMKLNIPWNYPALCVLFFPAAIAYSIVRHNLFEADVIIKRTVGYVIVTLIVVGAYAGISLAFNVYMGQYQLAQSRGFPILFTLGVILIFNPLRNRVQSLVDRIFFRKEYDSGAIVDKIGGAMTRLLDLGQILQQLMQTFVEEMFLNNSAVMLLSTQGDEYRVYLSAGETRGDSANLVLKRDDPLLEIIRNEQKFITKNDLLENQRYREVRDACAKHFDAMQSRLIIPMVFQEKIIGLLNLGDKKSGRAFNREDIELLHTIANQGAVAIENARLFEENLEKQRMEEELNIARDLQMSMLPAECPEIPGYKIAAQSTPAMEVGGDFYDFIQTGEGGLGFVIGDVTGKSVSGALVMSASRSVFRMLSEENLGVGEIMVKANRRTKKDIKPGMFVALLYALLDARANVLKLCSAGQTQPIRVSPQTGKAVLVQTEGDTFPLGILDEADYQETRIPMSIGDKVILYTDGIVEAKNVDGELFGFERLLEIVNEGNSDGANTLMNRILAQVDSFVGQAPQHDDLTVIVISREGQKAATG